MDILKVLIDSGATLTRMKKEGKGKPLQVIEGKSLLQLVASSGCSKKGAFIIDRIMNAKNKFDKSNNLKEICKGKHAIYKEKEMSEQEVDLVFLSEELGNDPENPDSIFRCFLKKNPDALVKLFDRCLISEPSQKNDATNVVFDFFLFKCDGFTKCEMDVIDLIFASGRKKLLEHPIFETFLRLKWDRSWKLFVPFFLLSLCNFLSVLGFALFNFGSFKVQTHFLDFWWYFLTATTSIFLMIELIKSLYFVSYFMESIKNIKFSAFWSTKRHLYQLTNVIHTGISPALGVLSLTTMNKSVTAVAVLVSSSIFMMAVTSIPRIGKNVFLTSQVMMTISEFFLSYSAQIFAFAITFHILLPGSEAFG